MNKFTNPVIEGFAPDPSVCAVGDDYYLVTSTFAYFPGVPVYHSKDLVNWKQIGNALHREEQLKLLNAEHSAGIFAPCIRYHEGTFYMITTNVSHGGNFLVTATDPAGPWSDPYFIDNAPGIDPSLFFDDDGKCYYVGTRPNPEGVKYNGDWEVWLQEFDLETMQLTGVSTKLWKGALHTAIWPEAPHIYKKDGYYYLLIAEGGTGFNHACTVARSERVDGPYIGNKNNPILTHRHLGKDFPVHNVGHGDFVETPDGKWYITLLASRIFDGYSNLGRETFLAEVVWEDGWPVVNPGVGRLLEVQEHKLPLVPVEQTEKHTFETIKPEFMFLRNPDMSNFDNKVREGWLRLHPTTTTIKDLASPTFLSVRQQSMWYKLSTHVELALAPGGEAGLVILQNDKYSIRLVAVEEENQTVVKMVTMIDSEETVVGSEVITEKDIVLEIHGTGQRVKGICRVGDQELVIAEDVDAHYLSTEVAGGFVGCTLGIYTTSTAKEPGYADFEWLENKKTNK
ncbi:glycoside hydrolase family 43 protein [Amphibacillus xylanus]|uniref:Xylosidase/arabinosidase n=1 Tax=Amphibacillus xylanus (strain ATCC 51415 / DSM 6626 / JCM 7361 / LMG 17667 / NBRC 15112 / Ep01) TaxID=698758 RepID=K0J135_AMPXN|nr:glycoside hydrolase family 43 protein [Amphibacillus xylanus]BAM48504.1 xylosidase/arabinosidase [Amphibacillus xylanus NBRC 15112]